MNRGIKRKGRILRNVPSASAKYCGTKINNWEKKKDFFFLIFSSFWKKINKVFYIFILNVKKVIFQVRLNNKNDLKNKNF